MRILTAALMLSLLIGSVVLCGADPARLPSTPFDQYGAIRWEDEKARLDNFAIQVQQQERYIGYILVYDATGGCPGEARARAARAKRYLTEYRGIPWNRVIWRRDGYATEISTTLLLVPIRMTLPYPFYDRPAPHIDGPLTRACKVRLRRIKNS
jgi:hypothetical protein